MIQTSMLPNSGPKYHTCRPTPFLVTGSYDEVFSNLQSTFSGLAFSLQSSWFLFLLHCHRLQKSFKRVATGCRRGALRVSRGSMLHVACPSTSFYSTPGFFLWALHDLPTYSTWLASLLQQPFVILIVGLLKSNKVYRTKRKDLRP